MNASTLKPSSTGFLKWQILATLTACLGMSSAWGVNYLNLAQSPATSAAQNIAPNLIYLLDDSG